MKRFGALFLAAVLGSMSTIATFEWINDKQDEGKKGVEYLTGMPASKVAYKLDEKGEVIPLDFTTAAEKLCLLLTSGRNKLPARRYGAECRSFPGVFRPRARRS